MTREAYPVQVEEGEEEALITFCILAILEQTLEKMPLILSRLN
jgi:hypothetical protein